MAETFFKEVQMCRKILLVLLILVVTAGSLSAQSVDIPERKRNNIIVASYNIKWLGEWPHEYDSLAAVIQHFDVCGILEVTDEDGLPPLIEALEDKTGRDWGYVYGIRTHRPGGSYQEAYAAVWRRDRVELGDGVVSGIWDWEEAFRNDPFIVSFKRRNFDFNLLLIHTRWSSDTCGTRAGEVATIAKQINWMRTFLQERDIILAGDFNYSGSSDAMIAMADSAGLTQIDPNHASAHKNLGVAYNEQGRAEEAIIEFETYLQLQPDAPDRKAVEEEIAKLKGPTARPGAEYRHPVGGYSLRYPDGWYYAESETQVLFAESEEALEVIGKEAPGVIFHAAPLTEIAESLGLTEITDPAETLEAIAKKLKMETGEIETGQVAGYPAALTDISGTFEDVPHKGGLVVYLVEERVVYGVALVPPDQWDSFRPTFVTMVNSLSFFEP